MNDYISFALLSFSSFFSLVNPLGTVPVFMGMTDGASASERRSIANRAVFTAVLTLVIFAFFGQVLFEIFGISVNGLRVVGGLIFLSTGYDMLQGHSARTKGTKEETGISYEGHSIAVIPLGIPIICGPGAITNAIVLMEDAATSEMKAILVGTIITIFSILLIALYAAPAVMRFLGETGNRVLSRLMGLIIMVIAVEFFFAGIKPVLIDIIQIATDR